MKLLFIILISFLFTNSNAQYTAIWTGWGHTSYQVQKGMDSLHWTTIGTVSGQLATADYQYSLADANYYYRIKADKDSSQAILVSEVLSIKTPPAKGKKTRIQTLSVKVSVTDRIHYTIESPQMQQMQYSLYDITGRKIRERTVNLREGTNEIFDQKPAVNGIYYGQFVGYFDKPLIAKIINE